MKYIRTKDRVCKNKPIERKFGAKGKGGYSIEYKESDIIAQADTIEELCDEFVVVSDNCERPIISALPFNELQLYAKGRTNYAICYGAIWTEWGLKFVAKINEEGELELL